MKKLLIGLVIACLAAGCAGTHRKTLLAAGYHPQYVDGYLDGYSAGCHAVGHPLCRYVQDGSRYQQDHRYKDGWQDGYSIARTDYAVVW